MATKKAGRPKSKDPRKLVSAYLTKTEKQAVEKKYGSLNAAVRKVILPKCG